MTELAPGIRMRLTAAGDAEATHAAYERNHAHLAPWEPRRPASFFTLAGQADRIRERIAEHAAGRMVPWVLTADGTHGEEIVGNVTLTNITLGPFRSANLGYWIDARHTGRGLACAAAQAACRAADEELGLHRVEAGTMLHNAASQRVLAKCGFERIGLAPRYLHIDGEWRDHVLFQRLLNDREP